MSSDVSLTGGGSSSITSPDTILSATTSSTSPITSTTPDTITKSTAKAAAKNPAAYNPELLQGMFLLWSMGSNSLALQNLAGGAEATTVKSANSIDTAAFLAQTQLKYEEICTNVLTAWSNSIHQQNEEIKKEMKSQAYQEWEKVHGHDGYESWLNTLSPEQRLQVQTYPHLDKTSNILDGLNDYLVKIKTSQDLKLNQDLPFITAALMTAGTFSALPDTVSTTQILVKPLKDAGDKILTQYAPNQAAELGYLGALFMNGASYFALGQTVAKTGAPEKEINYEFAKNYGQKVLSLVNGSEFNSMAMALLTNRIEGGETLSEERIQNLVMSVKIVMLSTALALLYKTESSFKGVGGGITGVEFTGLVNGNEKLADSQLKKDLVNEIAVARDRMPDNGTRLITGLSVYVDQARSSKDLIDVGGILNNLVYDHEAAGTTFAV